MIVDKIKLQILQCQRCGYKWIPRRISQQCPRCKSYYWNEDKDFDRRKKEYKGEEVKIPEKIILQNDE